MVQITEPQRGWGWQAALEVLWSKLSAHAGPFRVGCSGPCLRIMSISEVGDWWPAHKSASQWRSVFLHSEKISRVSFYGPSLLSCCWAPLARAQLWSICSPFQVFTHINKVLLSRVFCRLSNPRPALIEVFKQAGLLALPGPADRHWQKKTPMAKDRKDCNGFEWMKEWHWH